MTMATISRADEKLQLEDLHQYEEDIAGYCSLGSGGGIGGGSGGGDRSDSPPMCGTGVGGGGGRSHHVSGGVGMEQEKRIRREIANSNERRRMQSINAGFQSLRTLLPHHEGEKLSKAAILQQTAEYIYQLEQEKTRLLSQNCQLKRLVSQHTEGEAAASKKRKVEDIEVDSVTGATNDLIDVRVQLDRERRLRMLLEDQVRNLESQLYPERIREITQQVQLQYQQREDSSDVFTTSRSHFNQEGSLIISDGHDQDDKGSIVSGGAVITPMRRTSELLSASPETVAAVANLQVVAGGAAIQPVSHTETVIATVTGSPSASPTPNSRISSILEAAIKAEPKIEVERLSPHDDRSTVYVASTSRQNLKTIVEAIRHLEGDNLENLDFSDGGGERGIPMSIDVGHHHHDGDEDEIVDDAEEESEDVPPQDAPLALTTSNKSSPSSTVAASSSPSEKHATTVKVNMNQYLQFHQQQRPGVIVVKQHT